MRRYVNYVKAGMIEKILHILDIRNLATATWEIVTTNLQFSTHVDEDRS